MISNKSNSIHLISTAHKGDAMAIILTDDVEEGSYHDKQDGIIDYIYENIEQCDFEEEVNFDTILDYIHCITQPQQNIATLKKNQHQTLPWTV